MAATIDFKFNGTKQTSGPLLFIVANLNHVSRADRPTSGPLGRRAHDTRAEPIGPPLVWHEQVA